MRTRKIGVKLCCILVNKNWIIREEKYEYVSLLSKYEAVELCAN